MADDKPIGCAVSHIGVKHTCVYTTNVQTVRNVTFSLPVDLLRRAKMLAAENDI